MKIVSEEIIDFIEHVGVKGMHWGVRRGGKSKVKPSQDSKQANAVLKKAKTGTIRSLSNNEIRTFTTRLQLETQFRNATPSNFKKVMNTIRSILGMGKTMNEVAAFSNSASGQAVRSGMESRRKPKDNQKTRDDAIRREL